MFVKKENRVIVGSWSSPQDDAQRKQGEGHPDWPLDDHPDVVARFALPAPASPLSISNWKAHGNLSIDEKRQAVLGQIEAIDDPVNRELVVSAFPQIDPIACNGMTLVELLTHPSLGYDEAVIDDLFQRDNALASTWTRFCTHKCLPIGRGE